MKKHTPSERSEASGDSIITSTECLLRLKNIPPCFKNENCNNNERSSFCFRCALQLNPEDRSQA